MDEEGAGREVRVFMTVTTRWEDKSVTLQAYAFEAEDQVSQLQRKTAEAIAEIVPWLQSRPIPEPSHPEPCDWCCDQGDAESCSCNVIPIERGIR